MPYLLLQLFSLGSKAQEKRGWPGCLGFVFVPLFTSTLVFTVVVVVVVGLAVTLLVVVGINVVVVVGRRVVVVFLVVGLLLGANVVVFSRFTDG